VIALVRETGAERIVDLCSGGGGAAAELAEPVSTAVGRKVEVVLTDLYPNIPAFKERTRDRPGVKYRADSVDARRLPGDLNGLRTLFASFHHFNPEDASEILRGSVDQRQPIAVFEFTERGPVMILYNLFCSALSMLLIVPLIRPFRWKRVLWTYVIPAAPLATQWDGVVSCLRSYRPAELLELAARADPEHAFEWKAARLTDHFFVPLTVLTGVPKIRAGKTSQRT
jgi:hypothetical protein